MNQNIGVVNCSFQEKWIPSAIIYQGGREVREKKGKMKGGREGRREEGKREGPSLNGEVTKFF